MHRFLFFLLFLLFLPANAQDAIGTEKKVDILLDKVKKLNQQDKYEDVVATLQKAIDLSESAGYDKGTITGRQELLIFYAEQSNNEKVIESSLELEKLALKLKDYKVLSTLCKTRAIAYENLGLNDKTTEEYNLSVKYANLIPDEDQKFYNLSLAYYNMGVFYQDNSKKSLYYLEKALEEIKKVKGNIASVSLQKKEDMIISCNMNLGIFYFDSKNPLRNENLADAYMTKALDIIEKSKFDIDKSTQIDLFAALTELYLRKKEYKKAVQYGESALAMEKSNRMIYNRRVTYMVLAKAYIGLGEPEASTKYLGLFTKINDSINSAEKKAVEKPIKQIISEKEKMIDIKLNILIVVFVLLITLGILLWSRREKRLHQKYELVIKKLEEPKEQIETNSNENESAEKAPQKSIQIADETVVALLSKLEKFEKSNKFTKQEINFAYLTNYLNTNSKYLSEILKQHKGKSFSQYINDLRIDYIMNLLYNDPRYREYKISYLAEVSGFASRVSFTLEFKKITGINPSYFIETLKKEKTVMS